VKTIIAQGPSREPRNTEAFGTLAGTPL